ncbi:CPCC family cysteine-rich protein [Xanthomonas arboricola]|uniref:CPCC family cysteine-rich protein n=1 Tax=Xanthomonas arboricola TaxID=56448 RepID=UPI003CCEC11D
MDVRCRAVCFWGDDGQDDDDADDVSGGPNGEISLTEGRPTTKSLARPVRRWPLKSVRPGPTRCWMWSDNSFRPNHPVAWRN